MKEFKEKYKALVVEKNRKLLKQLDKLDHLKKINDRLYYDNFKKSRLMEFDRNDIKKKLKLTEFVVMQRAKKLLLFQKVKESLDDSNKMNFQ